LFITNSFEDEEGGREVNFNKRRISGLISVEIKARASEIGILVKRETTSKLTKRS